jgi:hapalindole-type alkaloid chlorinase
MVKRHESDQPLLRFVTIDAADIHSYPTAVADIYAGRLDGMIIRGVLPHDAVELVVDRLERGEFDMEAIKFVPFAHLDVAPHTLGRAILASGMDTDAYFHSAGMFREKCRALFRDTVDFEQRIEQTIGVLSGGLPVSVPSGPGHGSYTPATIRVLPDGHEIGIHVGNDFLYLPQCQHLAGLVDATQLSYFMPLTLSESGGELIVYALEWDDMAPHYTVAEDGRPVGPSVTNGFILAMVESYESMCFRPGPGDLLIFNGGRYYHRVAPTLGARPRRTIGGFLAWSKAGDAIHYWS